MKSILRYTAAAAALATVGFASNASAATGTAQATAEILSNLTVTVDASDSVLNFGSITDNGLAAAANVTVSPADVLACATGLVCTGTAAAPSFDVTGFNGQTVAVSFPQSSVQLTRTGGALGSMPYQMQVGTFTSSSSTVTLTGGAGEFSIGGTLTVNPQQAPGVYTGSVNVQVEYN